MDHVAQVRIEKSRQIDCIFVVWKFVNFSPIHILREIKFVNQVRKLCDHAEKNSWNQLFNKNVDLTKKCNFSVKIVIVIAFYIHISFSTFPHWLFLTS